MLNIINIDQNNFSISGTVGSGLKVYSKRGVVAKKCEPVYNELFSRVTIADKTSQIVSKTPVSQVSLDSVVYATAEEFVAAFNEMINNLTEATTTVESTTTIGATTTIEATTTLEATTTSEPTTTTIEYVDIGHTTAYATVSISTARRGMPITFTENGVVNSISFYHTGSGNALVAVYSNNGISDGPGTRLSGVGSSAFTSGWTTINLPEPLSVTNGQTVFITVCGSTAGLVYQSGTPGRKQSYLYDYELPTLFGEYSSGDNVYSIYCTYFK